MPKHRPKNKNRKKKRICFFQLCSYQIVFLVQHNDNHDNNDDDDDDDDDGNAEELKFSNPPMQ